MRPVKNTSPNKETMSAKCLFMIEKREVVKKRHPKYKNEEARGQVEIWAEAELEKMWNTLGDSERQDYEKTAAKLKKRGKKRGN